MDTANAYVKERAVGRGMKDSGIAREDVFLSTKLWPSEYENENAVNETPSKRKSSMVLDNFDIGLVCCKNTLFCRPEKYFLSLYYYAEGKTIHAVRCSYILIINEA